MSPAEETRDGPPLAVALHYQAPGAPRVVAKGRGAVGEAILAAAEAHGVPIERNPELAEALSRVELDAQIPEALYQAVAVVIAFVLRAARARSAGAASPRSPAAP